MAWIFKKIDSFAESIENNFARFCGIIAVWLTFNLFSLLNTGFVSDDAYNSQIRGILLQRNMTVFARTMEEVLGWAGGAGRFFPLNFYHYSLYSLCDNMLVIKSLTLGIIFLGVIFFARFVKNVSGSASFSLLAGISMPLFFQFRIWHDPILAFTALLPILFLMIITSVYLFEIYLRSKKGRFLLGSAFLYLLALLTYEIAYPFCVLFAFLAFMKSKDIKESLKMSAYHIGLGLVFVGLYFVLKSPFFNHSLSVSATEGTYPAANLHLNFQIVLDALKIQTSAAFPLSYYLFGKQAALRSLLFFADFLVIIPAALFVGVLVYRSRHQMIFEKMTSLFFTGLFFLMMPALVMSVSGHQEEIIQAGFGYGYLSIYFQYFGMSLVLLVLLSLILKRLPRKLAIFLSFLLSVTFLVVTSINLGQNRSVANEINAFYKHPRVLLGSALEGGIGQTIPDQSLIIRNMRFPSDHTWFYSAKSGKIFDFCEPQDRKTFKKCIETFLNKSGALPVKNFGNGEIRSIDLKNSNVYSLAYRFDRDRGRVGQLIVGKIDEIFEFSNTGEIIYLVSRNGHEYNHDQKQTKSIAFGSTGINFLQAIGDESLSAHTAGGFDLPRYSVKDILVFWEKEFLPSEGNYPDAHHWAGNDNEIVIANLTSETIEKQIKMNFTNPSPKISKLTVELEGKVNKFQLGETPVSFDQKIKLLPGRNVIRITSDGLPIQNGDPRKMVFSLDDFQLNDRTAIKK
jgi:hypothetical protein